MIKGKIEKTFLKCPICNLEPLTNLNIDLTKKINNKEYFWKIYNETIIENDFKTHILKWNYYKCILFEKKFGGKHKYFEYFSKDN